MQREQGDGTRKAEREAGQDDQRRPVADERREDARIRRVESVGVVNGLSGPGTLG